MSEDNDDKDNTTRDTRFCAVKVDDNDDKDNATHDTRDFYSKFGKQPHNGKLCSSDTIMRTSLGCKYLVTYSYADRSIVGWDVEGTDSKGRLKPDFLTKTDDKFVTQMCVSDNKLLVYIYSDWQSLSK